MCHNNEHGVMDRSSDRSRDTSAVEKGRMKIGNVR